MHDSIRATGACTAVQQHGRRTISVHDVAGVEVQQPRACIDGLWQGGEGKLSRRGPHTAPVGACGLPEEWGAAPGSTCPSDAPAACTPLTMPSRRAQVSSAAAAGLPRAACRQSNRLPREQYSVTSAGGSWHSPRNCGAGGEVGECCCAGNNATAPAASRANMSPTAPHSRRAPAPHSGGACGS